MTEKHAARWGQGERAGVDVTIDEALFARAISVIDAVIRRRCRNWKSVGDVPSEVRGEVLLRLLRRLRDRDSAPIDHLDEYIAGITSRAIDEFVRAALPEWSRLKHRVRYVLDHDDRFAISLFADGRSVCTVAVPSVLGRRRVRSQAAETLARMMLDVLRQQEVTLRESDMTIDELVNEIAARTGVGDPLRADATLISTPRVVEPDARIESVQTLRALWIEIVDLPRRQRLALLLNARDAAGDSVLRLFIAARVVTPREVALAVELRDSEVEPLIGRLPMPDADIAQWLQVTRQQVINLRRTARDRLARRTSRPR
jgi:hypothetical protein